MRIEEETKTSKQARTHSFREENFPNMNMNPSSGSEQMSAREADSFTPDHILHIPSLSASQSNPLHIGTNSKTISSLTKRNVGSSVLNRAADP